MPRSTPTAVAEPTITCPKCGAPVPLTDALAAPLIAATRVEYEGRLLAQEAGMAAEREELVRA